MTYAGPRTYRGWTISQGAYHGTPDNVAGRWYIDPPGQTGEAPATRPSPRPRPRSTG